MTERERRRERLERFVLRAGRVMVHSLIRDHMDLLQELAEGTFKVKATARRTLVAVQRGGDSCQLTYERDARMLGWWGRAICGRWNAQRAIGE